MQRREHSASPTGHRPVSSSNGKPTIAQVAAAAAARSSAGAMPRAESPTQIAPRKSASPSPKQFNQQLQQPQPRMPQGPWGRSREAEGMRPNGPATSSDILKARKHSLPITSAALALAASNYSGGPEQAWKVVGSPPRRFSLSVPPTPERPGSDNGQVDMAKERSYSQRGSSIDADDADELILSRQRGIRTRAATTPSPLVSAAETPTDSSYPPGFGPKTQDANAKWNSSNWRGSSPSLWPEGRPSSTSGSMDRSRSGQGPVEGSSAFPSRQYRSFSFSLASMRGLDGAPPGGDEKFDRNRVTTVPLRGGDDEMDSDEYEAQLTLSKVRTRSKSSSEIYGLLTGEDEAAYRYPPVEPSSPVTPPGSEYPDLNSIWARTQGVSARDASMMHRRGSSTSSATHWEHRGPSPAPMMDRLDQYRHRRFSHAPGLYGDFQPQMAMRQPSEQDMYDLARRRHSLAGPAVYGDAAARYLVEGMDSLNLNDHSDTPFLDEIDDYFENTKRRKRAWVEAGKNLQMQSYTMQWPLHVVEFKAGRTDYFYLADPTLGPVKKGDLVIVEADRGKDLGKVIEDCIMNHQQLQMYQASHTDTIIDAHNGNKEVHPKRIFRCAHPSEVTLLVSKSQDEAKAMELCTAKIRQKKLPMEIVDAEYQWDRRKLTFYFVADRRIDFRELVRELFKIYKTRIWMCAVNPMLLKSHLMK